MGKSSGSAPAAPDPQMTAQAQTQSNIETAKANAGLNRVNQITPYGSLTYTDSTPNKAAFDQAWAERQRQYATDPNYDMSNVAHAGNAKRDEAALRQQFGATEQWTAQTTLSPEQQRLLDLSTQAQTAYGEAGLSQLGKLRDQMSTPFAFQGAPAYQNVASRAGQVQSGYDTGGPIQRSIGSNDFSADRLRVEEALYGRLNPSLDQSRTSLETRLRSQGLAPGSEAWANAMRTQTQSENDARLGVVQAGGQEQSRLFGMDQARGEFANNAQNQAYSQNQGLAAFGNQAANQQQNMDLAAGGYGQQQRQQMLAEQLAIRNQPLNETAALLTGQQVQQPQFQTAPQVQVAPTDVLGAYNTQYQGKLTEYNGKVATNNANTGAAAGAAGAAITAAAVIA